MGIDFVPDQPLSVRQYASLPDDVRSELSRMMHEWDREDAKIAKARAFAATCAIFSLGVMAALALFVLANLGG